MTAYHRNIVQVDPYTVISLRCVESVAFPDDDQSLVDVLSDDPHLNLTMVSGKTYCVPMSTVQENLPMYKNMDRFVLRMSIVEKWMFLIEG